MSFTAAASRLRSPPSSASPASLACGRHQDRSRPSTASRSPTRTSTTRWPTSARACPRASTRPARRKYVLDYLIDLKLVASKAVSRQGRRRSRVRAQARLLPATSCVMEPVLGKVAKEADTDDAEHAAYDAAAKAQPPEEEIHARHILLPDEATAKTALARVKAGEDFAKVADELSKDPGSKGGDLGWFTKDRMVPEFSDAAFKLKPGEVSEPVKIAVRLAHHQGRGQAHQDLPALRPGEGPGRPLRAAEGADRADHRRCARTPRSSASTRRPQRRRDPAAPAATPAPAASATPAPAAK